MSSKSANAQRPVGQKMGEDDQLCNSVPELIALVRTLIIPAFELQANARLNNQNIARLGANRKGRCKITRRVRKNYLCLDASIIAMKIDAA
ncbi:MAG: hypothetical protein M0R33_23485 [Methylomonas sp.]|jgi:hypothetical protein|uniref:hypothetical protein n=1 Tax=Methylomonas sp. TaxID=418 RepID=UPI0025E8BE50|nr:hypothetical protein [Methylomonas sp.]MCK9609403.1 hypothetical protein [Methylomonas sp.]